MLLEGWVTGSVGCYGIIHILEGFLEEEPFEQGFYGPRPSWDGQAGLGFPTGASTQSLVWAGLLNSRLLLGKKPACGRQRGWYQRARGAGVGVGGGPPAQPAISSFPSPCWTGVKSEHVSPLPLGLIS